MSVSLVQAVRRRVPGFGRDVRAVSAIEFALVGLPFFMLLIGIMVVALLTFSAASLDYAVQKAARAIMVGNAQSAGLDAARFQTELLCPNLPAGLFDCSKLLVSLTSFADPVTTDYYSYVKPDLSGLIVPTQAAFCLGAASSYQVLEVTYPFPIYFAPFAGAPQVVNGKYMLMSSLTFKNEPFTTSAGGC